MSDDHNLTSATECLQITVPLPGVICPVTNEVLSASRKKRAKKRLQIAQSPTREAKLVILPYRTLKKTENRSKNIPKADAAEKHKKCEKSKQRIAQKNFFKKTSVYHAKNWESSASNSLQIFRSTTGQQSFINISVQLSEC